MIRASLPGVLAAMLVTVAMLALLAMPMASASAPAGGHGHAAAVILLPVACMEDAPCWRWSRMGNHKRGVVTMHGTPLVVGPCRFARLYAHRNLDRWPFNRLAPRSGPASGRLRGDAWAIRYGCADNGT